MKNQQIQDLFNQRYNQATWKQFLGQAFANVQLLSTPENLTGIDHRVADNAQKLGYIFLNEDGIRIYKVENTIQITRIQQLSYRKILVNIN